MKATARLSKEVIRLLLVFAGLFFSGVVAIAFVILSTSVDWYEYEALTANDCLEGESYDARSQVCYLDLTCDSKEQCRVADRRYNTVVQSFTDTYLKDTINYQEHQVSEIRRSRKSTEKNFSPLAIEDFLDIILPESHRANIVSVVEDSDGLDDTLAYVEVFDEYGAEWLFAYDPVDTYTSRKHFKNIRELVTTLIHEYAHVLMLNNMQVTHYPERVVVTQCFDQEIQISEGCAKPDSYIAAFVTRFWTEEERSLAEQARENREEEDFAYDSFMASPTNFVSEYAATNEIEDMAESFTHFVLESKPTGEVESEKKVLFFWEYPELVSLRTHMRTGIAVSLFISE